MVTPLNSFYQKLLKLCIYHQHRCYSEHRTYCTSLSLVCVSVCIIFTFRTKCCLATLCSIFTQDVPDRHGVCELRRREILVLQTRELEWRVIMELTSYIFSIAPFTLCIEFIFFHYRSDCCWSGVSMVSVYISFSAFQKSDQNRVVLLNSLSAKNNFFLFFVKFHLSNEP